MNMTSIKLYSRLAVTGLVTQRKLSIVLILNIALGILGFLVVQGFNQLFLNEISSRTRTIAGGDLIASSRTKPTNESIANLEKNLPPKSMISLEQSLLTMVSAGDKSRLIEIRFIDENFPLYGSVKFENQGAASPGVGRTLSGTKKAWVYPELKSQLGLKVGDEVTIGKGKYTVSDFVIDDPSTSGIGFVIAPRIYVDAATADDTGLIELGSRVQWLRRYKLAPNTDSEKLETSLRKTFSEQEFKIRSHHSASEEITRIQAYLNDYLGLIALASLFLAGIGTSYLLRGHLSVSTKEFGILVSLGGKPTMPAVIFSLQAIILGIIGSLVALVLHIFFLPIMQNLMSPITGSLATSLKFTDISWSLVAMGCLAAMASGFLVSLPLLVKLIGLRPTFLFQESSIPSTDFKPKTLVWYLPAIVLWWLAAIWQSHSLKNGSLFAGLFLGSGLILVGIGFIILKLIKRIGTPKKLNWTLNLAFTQLVRNPSATLTAFLALALGSVLISVIPQLRESITRELKRPDSIVPQFFMFDIQDEQIEPLKNYLTAKKISFSLPSPMIRAKLEKIDAVSIESREVELEGQREQERRENLQTRMQNLSYRPHLTSAETIVEGLYDDSVWDQEKTPSISVEADFAKRLGIKLGNIMTFDVSGIPIEGKVTSLRKVKWTSFQPNFFILFQPGVLDDAPKIWVTSASGINTTEQDLIQNEIVKQWSNVSVIDVKSAIQRVVALVDQISNAVGFVAWLAVLSGLGVIFAVASFESQKRRYSFALLKSLGANISQTTMTTMMEFAIITITGIGFGVVFSIGLGALLSTQVFNAPWTLNWEIPARISLILVPLNLFLTWFAMKGSLNERVSSLLRS